MSNVYFVMDDRIAFIPGESRLNGMVVTYPIALLTTKYGVLIPLSQSYNNFQDLIEGNNYTNIQYPSKWLCAVVDKDGVLRDYYLDDQFKLLTRNRIQYGTGARVSRSQFLVVEEQAYSALRLAKTLEDAVALYCKTSEAKYEDFVFYKISNLAKIAADYKEAE